MVCFLIVIKFTIILFRGIVPKTKVVVRSSTQFHVPRNWHELWLKFSLLLNDSCTLLDAIEVHIQTGWHFLLKYGSWQLNKFWVENSNLLSYVLLRVAGVLKDCIAFIFRVKVSFFGLLDPKDKCSTILWNVENYWQYL